MYAVVALFNLELEQRIKMIWEGLESNEISYYAREVGDRVPHITLANYKDIPVMSFIHKMGTFYKGKEKVRVDFQTIGSFINTKTLFYSPTITEELLDLHSDHHRNFASFIDDEESVYLPGKWVPHCNLANRLSEEKLKDAYNYCLKMDEKLKGEINRIGLIRIDSKKHAPLIYSESLI
ncbi:2'-5' RNA ligase family protein [Niallia circulans]|uniref:2'-5' RNA ligase family protein n=1 Tax=Niallia circulans TaxID=1397 RepID=UPI003D956C10